MLHDGFGFLCDWALLLQVSTVRPRVLKARRLLEGATDVVELLAEFSLGQGAGALLEGSSQNRNRNRNQIDEFVSI